MILAIAFLALALATGGEPANKSASADATSSLQEYFLEQIEGDRTPDSTGHIDVVIDPFDGSPFRLSIEPGDGIDTPRNTVSVLDMKEPAWIAALRLAGAGHQDGAEAWSHVERVEFSVDSHACAALDAEASALEQAFVSAKEAFRPAPASDEQLVVTSHPRHVEVRFTDAEFVTLAFIANGTGPVAVMDSADRLTQAAAECARKPVRRLSDIH